MAKMLITGISGQDGAFLARGLLEKGHEVYGAMRRGSTPKTDRPNELGIRDKNNYCTLEVTEFANVKNVLNTIQPNQI